MVGRLADDCHFASTVTSTIVNVRRTGLRGRNELFSNWDAPRPKLSVYLANFVRSINKILIMPSRHASPLAPHRAGSYTPDPALAARAWVLHRPQPRPSWGP